MRRMATALVAAGLLLGAGRAAAVEADGKQYVGSWCSFADFPLKSHNKIHHKFLNTSGASQWITCPAVREMGEGIRDAWIDLSGTASGVALEFRTEFAGTVAGFAPDGYQGAGSGTAVQYQWNYLYVPSGAVMAFEVKLPNNSGVFKYGVSEDDTSFNN
jgi:hypothetical protein